MIRDTNYRQVTATAEENAEHARTHNGPPRTYRVECVRCGKRLWYSGLAKGSHERWHDRQRAANRSQS